MAWKPVSRETRRQQAEAARQAGFDQVEALAERFEAALAKIRGLKPELDNQAEAMHFTAYGARGILHEMVQSSRQVSGYFTVVKDAREAVRAADAGEPLGLYATGDPKEATPKRIRETAEWMELRSGRNLFSNRLGRHPESSGWMDPVVMRTQPLQSREEQEFLDVVGQFYDKLEDNRLQLDTGRAPTSRRSGTYAPIENCRKYLEECVKFYEIVADAAAGLEMKARPILRGEKAVEISQTPHLSETTRTIIREGLGRVIRPAAPKDSAGPDIGFGMT